MRGVLLVLALLTGAVSSAGVPSIHAGADLGLLMREEAGGQRTPLPALVLRGSYGRFGPAELSAVYQFAFALEGAAVRGFSQHHRLHLRPEVVLHLGTAALSFSAGPGLALTHSVIWAGDAEYGVVSPRWTLGGELALHVHIGATRLRTGVDVTYSASRRVDLLVSVGAAFGFGGER